MKTVTRSRDERGASLVLALAFLFAIGVVIVAVAGFSVQASITSVNTRQQAHLEATAESAGTAAVQQVRVSYAYPQSPGDFYQTNLKLTPTAEQCSPAGAVTTMAVYCEGYRSGTTRLVDFFVCASSVSLANCTSANSPKVLLYAQVSYIDVPDGGAPGSGSCFYNSGTNFSNATCGEKVIVNEWDVRTADN